MPDDTQIVIKNGSNTIQVVNVRHADASTPITYADMKQICRYDTSIGWRWVFNARYAVTDTGIAVFVMPSFAFQDSRYVTTDTAQNITAGKNFVNNTTSTNIDAHTNMSICLKNEQAELGADTVNADGTVNFKYQGIRTVDKNNEEVSYLYSAPDGVGGSFTRLGSSTKVNGEYADAVIEIEVDANGKGHLYIPDVDTDSTASGNQGATKEYVDSRDNAVISRLNRALPTGTIITWSTSTAPAGYLVCDGSAISRTTYAALFSVIGTTYGEGDGNTTFNVPNARNRVPFQWDAVNVGMLRTGGIPNITGSLFVGYGSTSVPTGAFYNTTVLGNTQDAASSKTSYQVAFDASRISKSYGRYGSVVDGVIPNHFCVLFCIKY